MEAYLNLGGLGANIIHFGGGGGKLVDNLFFSGIALTILGFVGATIKGNDTKNIKYRYVR